MYLFFSSSISSSSQQYGTTYGELELFLCGLDLSQFVPLFQSQHVEFNTFLRLTEEDLIKVKLTIGASYDFMCINICWTLREVLIIWKGV